MIQNIQNSTTAYVPRPPKGPKSKPKPPQNMSFRSTEALGREAQAFINAFTPVTAEKSITPQDAFKTVFAPQQAFVDVFGRK